MNTTKEAGHGPFKKQFDRRFHNFPSVTKSFVRESEILFVKEVILAMRRLIEK